MSRDMSPKLKFFYGQEPLAAAAFHDAPHEPYDPRLASWLKYNKFTEVANAASDAPRIHARSREDISSLRPFYRRSRILGDSKSAEGMPLRRLVRGLKPIWAFQGDEKAGLPLSSGLQ